MAQVIESNEDLKPAAGGMLSEGRLPVMEIFGPTMQGEGWMAGKQSYFVRFGGCSFRCNWCDSMHAVDPQSVRDNARWMRKYDIVIELETLGGALACEWVTLSGGDPAIWDQSGMINALHAYGYKVAMETQGYVHRTWMAKLNLLTVSPKGPSSGMLLRYEPGVLYQVLTTLAERVVMKIVIADQHDLEWAADMARNYPQLQLYLSAMTPPPFPGEDINDTRKRVSQSYTHLVKKALNVAALKNAILLPQLHVLVWGHQKGV